jgi:hypothetical protein
VEEEALFDQEMMAGTGLERDVKLKIRTKGSVVRLCSLMASCVVCLSRGAKATG